MAGVNKLEGDIWSKRCFSDE